MKSNGEDNKALRTPYKKASQHSSCKGPGYSHLGHFAQDKFINEGHNTGDRIGKPGEAEKWDDDFNSPDPVGKWVLDKLGMSKKSPSKKTPAKQNADDEK